MCGITGIVDVEGRGRIDRELLVAMSNTLAHRGPDDWGLHMESSLGFAFRRLSIIDLTSGNQPIYNEDKSVVVVCNGEIYNHLELRDMLEAKGHRFYTRCDVEVLVHLFEELGTAFLNRLNGQFAFAIRDGKSGDIFLARDHVGIAPLFWTLTDGLFLFASEIKALLKHPAVKREVDLTALDQVFSFPGMVSPRTMFKGIHALEPGHTLTVKNGGIETREYWDLDYPQASDIADGRPESHYLEQLEELLGRAVAYRLQADVPVGFYLSGGMDSSLVAAMIHRLHPEKRHSFSIGFDQPEIDERRYQRLMVEQVKSIHHEVLFGWEDIGNRLRQAVYHGECPLKESYDTCSLALSELVRRSGIKVVLTGEGSDELFAGYVGYRFDLERPDLGFDEDADPVAAALEREIRENLWGDPDLLYERSQFEFREIKQALYSHGVNERFEEFDCVRQGLVDRGKLRGRHPLHKRSYLDFKLRLSDHLLADHGDRVAFANSVEARYPFLDIDVVEFARTVPPRLLVSGSTEKFIVKRLAARYLAEQITRREKFAFVAPGSPYLLKQDIEWINDCLSRETIKRQGYFNPDTIERLKKMYCRNGFNINQTFENDLLMIVLTFGIFLGTFDMPDHT